MLSLQMDGCGARQQEASIYSPLLQVQQERRGFLSVRFIRALLQALQTQVQIEAIKNAAILPRARDAQDGGGLDMAKMKKRP
jgi:hypothetical protein